MFVSLSQVWPDYYDGDFIQFSHGLPALLTRSDPNGLGYPAISLGLVSGRGLFYDRYVEVLTFARRLRLHRGSSPANASEEERYQNVAA